MTGSMGISISRRLIPEKYERAAGAQQQMRSEIVVWTSTPVFAHLYCFGPSSCTSSDDVAQLPFIYHQSVEAILKLSA